MTYLPSTWHIYHMSYVIFTLYSSCFLNGGSPHNVLTSSRMALNAARQKLKPYTAEHKKARLRNVEKMFEKMTFCENTIFQKSKYCHTQMSPSVKQRARSPFPASNVIVLDNWRSSAWRRLLVSTTILIHLNDNNNIDPPKR